MEPDQYFPNQFYNFNIKSRAAYFPSSDGNKLDAWANRASGIIKEKFFIEMAIFIDRELFKIMQENFPVDTEEHIIQVVIAMINAVFQLHDILFVKPLVVNILCRSSFYITMKLWV